MSNFVWYFSAASQTITFAQGAACRTARIARLVATAIFCSTGMYPRHLRRCGGQKPKSPANNAQTSGSFTGHQCFTRSA